MSQVYSLNAEARETGRKSIARGLRLAGRVPGIIYGGAKEPELVSFDGRELFKLWNTGTFQSHILMVSLGDAVSRVIPRDVQLDPVSDVPLHVDLLRLEEGATINIEIPVHFINDTLSPGIKRGGVLNVVRHEIELICPIETIPETITIDLANLDINDSVHISAIVLPEGVRPAISDRDFTIATIAPPTVQTEEPAPAAAAAAAPAAAEPAAKGSTKS